MRCLLPLLILLAACEPMPPSGGPALEVPIAAGDSLANLTGTIAFQGELPCADCPGIRETLVLRADGSYRLEDAYQRPPSGAEAFLEVGRWRLDATGQTLTLDGPREGAQQFRVDSEQQLTMLDQSGAPIVSTLNYSLRRIPSVPPVGGVFRQLGAFSYYADAALYVTCAGGVQFPISGGPEYLALERAYADARPAPAEPVPTWLTGRLELQPAMEGDAPVESVVVDSAAVRPGAPCAVLSLRGEVGAGRWNLAALDGEPVPPGPDPERTPHLEFRLDPLGESRLAGTAGCNRVSGRLVLRGAQLVGGPVATTMMMCADSTVMARERRLGTVLGDGGWLRLDGAELVLLQGGREVVRMRR